MQRVSIQLLTELQNRSDITVIPLTLETEWNNVVANTAGFLLKLLAEIPTVVQRTKSDMILFSSMVTASLSPVLKRRINVPMVTINHGHDVTMSFSPYQYYLRYVFDNLDGVISVSSATRMESVKRGADEKRSIALPNGFLDEWLEFIPSKETAIKSLHERYYIGLDKKILTSVGRQVKRKGHEWFIRNVMPKVNDDVIFLLVGDGPEHETIKKAVVETGQTDRIILLGRCSDKVLHEVYAGADLFVMPNIPIQGDMEGFGIVMLEAALAGTPTIASELEGIKDVIKNGANGYLIKPLDSDEFAKKINHVLGNELNELSVTSKSYVLENFNWKYVTNKYVDFLKMIHNTYHNGQI